MCKILSEIQSKANGGLNGVESGIFAVNVGVLVLSPLLSSYYFRHYEKTFGLECLENYCIQTFLVLTASSLKNVKVKKFRRWIEDDGIWGLNSKCRHILGGAD